MNPSLNIVLVFQTVQSPSRILHKLHNRQKYKYIIHAILGNLKKQKTKPELQYPGVHIFFFFLFHFYFFFPLCLCTLQWTRCCRGARRLLFIYPAGRPEGMIRAHWNCWVTKEKWITPFWRATQHVSPSLLGYSNHPTIKECSGSPYTSSHCKISSDFQIQRKGSSRRAWGLLFYFIFF